MKIDCLCASSLFSKLKYRSLEKSYCTCSVIICIFCGVAQAYGPSISSEQYRGKIVNVKCQVDKRMCIVEVRGLIWVSHPRG